MHYHFALDVYRARVCDVCLLKKLIHPTWTNLVFNSYDVGCFLVEIGSEEKRRYPRSFIFFIQEVKVFKYI